MGAVRIQSKKEISSANVSFDSTPTPGNLVIVAITRWNDISSGEVSDNQGNTYTFIRKQPGGPGTDTGALFYAKNILASGTFTVSYAGGGTISIHEYSGLDLSNPLDQQNSNNGSSTTPDSGNVTTGTDGELFFALAWSIQNGDSWAANNGFTLRENETDNNTYERHATADKIGNAQTTSGNFTVSSSDSWLVLIATFKPSAGSPPTGFQFFLNV